MDEITRGTAMPDRLTPDLAAEVQRNLQVWLGVVAGAVAVFCVLFGWLVDPDLTGVGAGFGVVIAGSLLALLLVVAGLLVTLAYLFGCWPAFLRRRVLADRYGVAASDVSGAARNRLWGDSGLWAVGCGRRRGREPSWGGHSRR